SPPGQGEPGPVRRSLFAPRAARGGAGNRYRLADRGPAELASQPVRAVARRGPRDRGGGEHVEAVHGAGVDVQFGGYRRPAQSRRELDRLVAQAVRRADADECRWQATQFVGPRRCRIRRHVVRAVPVAEITAPAERVGFAGPYRQALELARRG